MRKLTKEEILEAYRNDPDDAATMIVGHIREALGLSEQPARVFHKVSEAGLRAVAFLGEAEIISQEFRNYLAKTAGAVAREAFVDEVEGWAETEPYRLLSAQVASEGFTGEELQAVTVSLLGFEIAMSLAEAKNIASKDEVQAASIVLSMHLGVGVDRAREYLGIEIPKPTHAGSAAQH